MKKLISLFSIVFLAAGMSFAQKYAFVDTEYILERKKRKSSSRSRP